MPVIENLPNIGSAPPLFEIIHITVELIRLLNEKGVPNDFLVYENSEHAQDKDTEKVIEAKKIIEKYAQKYF